MLESLLKFIWYRNSEWASCLCICLAKYMSVNARRDIADYMHAVNDNEATRAERVVG